MANPPLRNLTFPRISYGTHQTPWNLEEFLYIDACLLSRPDAAIALANGKLGKLEHSRIPLVSAIHDTMTAKLERGLAGNTAVGQLDQLRRFWTWAEAADMELTLESVIGTYQAWCDALLRRVQINKDMAPDVARKSGRTVGDLLARSTGFPKEKSGAAWVRTTALERLRAKRALVPSSSKQDLSKTFEFGHFLTDLCRSLDVAAICGELPIRFQRRSGELVILASGLHFPERTVEELSTPGSRRRALRARAPLERGGQATRVRAAPINLRIEAELSLFIAQTGMSLSQACKLRRCHYRWQSDGEDLLAYRTYKGRRAGEAEFRCFKAYRSHLAVYLSWLDELYKDGDAEDGRLFPFNYTQKVPAERTLPKFKSLRTICRANSIRFFPTTHLRKTRVNWLLRYLKDPELTAAMSGHSKGVMLSNYVQPNHQVAIAEIARFHQATDPSVASPEGGRCVGNGRNPKPIREIPPEAPRPDCISAEGCLFCMQQRDVMSADYCWKLATHARLKLVELALNKHVQKDKVHPNERVVDRILLKLGAIAAVNKTTALWVSDATDAVKSGRYHELWDGHLSLLEILT